jgi:hypothetical protein
MTWGTKDIQIDEKSTSRFTWHDEDNDPHKTRGCGNQLNCHWLLEYFIALVGTSTQAYVTVPQYGPTYTYSKLEGPLIAKLDIIFPTV